MADGFQWEIPPEQAFLQLYDDYARRIYRAIAQLARSFAPRIEAWMKENRVWTDRTGNARQGLFADVELALHRIVLFMDHGVSYGEFLELKHQGQYAIIGPALDYWAPRFWAAVQQLFR